MTAYFSAMATAEEIYDAAIELFAEGKHAEAIDAYRKALEIDPGFLDALHGLAIAQAENGDLAAAIETAKRIIESSPDDPLGYTSLSMFYQRNGQIAEAEAAAGQARIREWKQQLRKPGDEK
ncbi:MAG: tetratricopeptide repeat protein [Candidatus Binatia bacterium]